MYKSIIDSPTEVVISKYWSYGDMSYLREGLPISHPEHLWNWFKREYPELNPTYYGIENPKYEQFKDMSKEEVIDYFTNLKDSNDFEY